MHSCQNHKLIADIEDDIMRHDANAQPSQLISEFSLEENLLICHGVKHANLYLRKKFEKAKKERDDLKLTLEKFENSSKNLSKLLEIQENDKYKIGEGYHVVPHPYTRNFMPPKHDLVLADEEEYVFSESIPSVPVVATSEVKISKSKPKSVSEPLIEDWISDSKDENETEFKSKQRKPSFTKVEFVKSNKHVKSPREFVKKDKNNKQANHPRKNSQSPRAVLMKSGLKTLNTARQNSSRVAVSVNTARPINTAYPKPTVNCARPSSNVSNRVHSHVSRPFNKFTTNKNNNFNEKVNTVKGNVTTVGPKAIGNPQLELQEKGVINSGCSRHITGNKSYLSDYEEIDEGFVTFGGSTKGGKITDTECVVLSPDFKLLDENQVLLRVPRKNNMYSVDLKNVVLSGGLSCLFANATLDESNLWHRRLGHINFKTMNKLSIMKKMYCLVVTDDYSRFSSVFFLATKDETSGILKVFITGIENQINQRVKTIKCDNGTEFKNKEMNQLCEMKGIKREFSVVRTPQQNGVAERKNITLIEAARTMLADSKLPTTFWAKVVNTACRKLALSFMRPFGCPVTILNTLDHLGKFNGKADEGLFVGYSVNSKARVETVPGKDYILLPLWTQNSTSSFISKNSPDAGFKPSGEEEKKDAEDSKMPNIVGPRLNQEKYENVNSTNNINTGSLPVNDAGIEDNVVDENIVIGCVDDPNMPNLEEIVYSDDDEGVGVEADMTNLDTNIPVSPIPTTRIHKDHLCNRESTIKTFRTEELLQFKLQQVWTLVDLPYGKRAIGTKWVYRNKKDERVARIEAIRLFLAYASFKDFVVYQIDVKSAFLYGKIEEEVYVYQPPGFEDPEFPNRVYKVEKALFGLHQAPKAWYETLSTYLLDNGFHKGQIDKTLFIKKVKGDILLVQVYVDDIIFGSTRKEICTEFEKLMHKKFQMSSMGELTFFLGLQVTQKDDGIFISQDKYVDEILKKFGFSTMRTTSTPIETSKPLMKDENAEDVDVHLYRSMIGSLMYLTSSRPDIMFVVCACARFQVTPKVSHLHAVKRIFRYLKGQPKLGLWYPKDSPFDLEAYTNSDYVGASLDRKSTIGGCQFLRSKLISWQCKKQTVVANSTTEAKPKRKAIEISQSSGLTTLVANETVHEEKGDSVERASTTAASLDAEQDSGSGPRRQDTILGDRPAQTRFERLSKQSNDPPLLRVNTLGSGEDRLKIMELMEIYTRLSERFLALENIKTTQDLEIINLKKRVKKLEKNKKARTPQLKRRLFKVRIESFAEKSLVDQKDASKRGRNEDQDEDISWFQEDVETQGRYGHDIEITTVEPVTTASVPVTTASPTRPVADSIIDDITLAETLMKIKSNKGKGIMHEPQKPMKLKGKDQIAFDEEVARRLEAQIQAELEEEEEERVARQREEEANLIS
ncbi:putative ribonuclease H-like domain-containing protein [Tanacetum coccineum]